MPRETRAEAWKRQMRAVAVVEAWKRRTGANIPQGGNQYVELRHLIASALAAERRRASRPRSTP